jgi:hypothetical protein
VKNTALCKFPTFKLFLVSSLSCRRCWVTAPLLLLSDYSFQKRSGEALRSALHRQVELLALHDLRPVDVEEIGVEDSLDEAGDDGNGVEVTFHCVPVHLMSVNC